MHYSFHPLKVLKVIITLNSKFSTLNSQLSILNYKLKELPSTT